MRILIVASDASGLTSARPVLEAADFSVARAERGIDARELASHYDLILLDFELRDTNAVELLQALRQERIMTPAIVVNDVADTDTLVECFDAGADDYLKAPFHSGELVARANAVLRRSKNPEISRLYAGPVTLVCETRTAYAYDEPIDTSWAQYTLLELLCINKGKLVELTTIRDRLYGHNRRVPTTNAIASHMSRLKKLLREHEVPDMIRAIRNYGYRLDPPTE